MKAYIAVFLILAVANIGAFAYSNLEHSQRLEELVNIASAEATLSEKDFSMVTFNPSTNAEDREIYAAVLSNPEFAAYRNNRAQLEYGMSLAEYDRQHAAELKNLMDFAKQEGVSYNVEQDHFDSVLNRIDARVTGLQMDAEAALQAAGMDQVNEDQVAGIFNIFKKKKSKVSALKKVTHLFKTRLSLRSSLFDDVLHFSVGSLLQKGLNALANVVLKNKCSWCKSIFEKIKAKACQVAGDYVCKLAANACNGIVPGAGVVLSKYACGSPIKLAGRLAHWCELGVQKIQTKTGWTDACLCSHIHGPTITIPGIHIPLICKTSPVSVPVGDLCAKPAGCA